MAQELDDAGFSTSGDTGESDPIAAIEDVLRTFAAQRIVVFRRPECARRYREDGDPLEIQKRFGLPAVNVATVPMRSAPSP